MDKFKNLTAEQIATLGMTTAAVLFSLGYFIRSLKK